MSDWNNSLTLARLRLVKLGGISQRFFHYAVSLSFSCSYIFLTGDNTFSVLVQLGIQGNITAFWLKAIAGLVVLVPFTLCKTLREVTLLGISGAFTTITVVLCVAIYGGITYDSLAPINHELFETATFAQSLGMIAFAYGGSVVYPHVEATMRNPRSWNQIVIYAVASVSAIYMLVATTGYLYYGDGVKDNILNSISKGPMSIIMYVIFTLHLVVAAPIYLCSFALELENFLKIDTQHMSRTREFIIRVLFRSSIVTGLTLFAMFVDKFSFISGLCGAIANCMTVFLIPVFCHFKLYGWRKRSIWELVFAAITVFVGLFGFVVSTYITIQEELKPEEK
ncbi:hypothetical protein DSO57_1026588 [Entomophthora muscae]|uniref:Uncharacterized protein n=1 Tax=Entomophthora muscae TaxID=34485 RepID=A0ACC2S3N3_9FUNG|nr:hypothetical protein DSO57_1026588 [Entomophthora muscae]